MRITENPLNGDGLPTFIRSEQDPRILQWNKTNGCRWENEIFFLYIKRLKNSPHLWLTSSFTPVVSLFAWFIISCETKMEQVWRCVCVQSVSGLSVTMSVSLRPCAARPLRWQWMSRSSLYPPCFPALLLARLVLLDANPEQRKDKEHTAL